MPIRHTVCNRDCPDTCRIEATVENGRVVKLAGDRNHPVTRGFLCYRTNHYLERQYDPERLTTPLLRTSRDAPFQSVSYDSALDYVAEQLRRVRDELGPHRILHYRSGGSLGMLVSLSDYFFELFGPVARKHGDICSGAGEAAQALDFGRAESNDIFDLERARTILLWGKNVFTSSPHVIPILKRARAAGAQIITIDPVWTRTATLADSWLQPRPGGDFALAMALANAVFAGGWVDEHAAEFCDGLDGYRELCESKSLLDWCREADVTIEQVKTLARALGTARPATILVGWGMTRRRNGGGIVRAIDALGAITGNIGVPGAGVSFYFGRRDAFVKPGGKRQPPRTVAEPRLGPDLLALDEPMAMMFVTAGNPVAMLPDSAALRRALEQLDTLVVCDSWMSDTAQLAHVVLPTPTLLEADDILGSYGHHYLGVAQPVVAQPQGVRSDLEIVQGLANRLGLGDALAGTARDWKVRVLGESAKASGVSVDALESGAVRNPRAPEIVFKGKRFDTANGKAQLITSAPPGHAVPEPEFPLLLMAASHPRSQSSQWVGRQPVPPPLTVHPDAAAGIADGTVAALESRHGRLTVRVHHDARQRRDVALLPKGGALSKGACANALIGAALTDIGDGGALYDEPVRLVSAAAKTA